MELDPQAQRFLAMLSTMKRPDFRDSVEAARSFGHDDLDWGGPVPDGVTIQHRFITTPTADVPVRIYTPQTPGPYGGHVYFHGGGWVLNHIDRYDAELSEIALKTNSIVVSVNYQKSPEHKFPVPHDDCFATLMWLIDHHEVLHVDRNRIGISGDSAGGNLAAGIALRARDNNIELAFQVLIYPAVTLNFNSESYVKNAEGYGLTSVGMQWLWEQYVNENDKNNPYAVPGVAKDFSNLAPAIVVTAEYDVLRDDGIFYAELLRKAGNQVEHRDFGGQIHGLWTYAKFIDTGFEMRSWIIDQITSIISQD